MDCDEAKKALLSMLWEYSPSSANLASNWLRAKKALLWMRKKGLEIKITMDDGVDILLASEGIDLLVDLWEAQACFWDPDIVVSWITLWGMIKVYSWLDFSLHFGSSCLLSFCFSSAASLGRSVHLIISQLTWETKHSSSNCPNHIRGTKRSSIVRRPVRSMFGELTVRPVS